MWKAAALFLLSMETSTSPSFLLLGFNKSLWLCGLRIHSQTPVSGLLIACLCVSVTSAAAAAAAAGIITQHLHYKEELVPSGNHGAEKCSRWQGIFYFTVLRNTTGSSAIFLCVGEEEAPTQYNLTSTQHNLASTQQNAASTQHNSESTQHNAAITQHNNAASTQHNAVSTQISTNTTQHSEVITQWSINATQCNINTMTTATLSVSHTRWSCKCWWEVIWFPTSTLIWDETLSSWQWGVPTRYDGIGCRCPWKRQRLPLCLSRRLSEDAAGIQSSSGRVSCDGILSPALFESILICFHWPLSKQLF